MLIPLQKKLVRIVINRYKSKVIEKMDLIRENVNTLRDAIQRNNLDDTTVIDVFTAIHVLLGKRIDYSITDDKYFAFLFGCVRNVPVGKQRHYWFDTMFRTYEKLSGVNPTDGNWLLLQANLVYLSPLDHVRC